MENSEICPIERRAGMSDPEFLQYLELLERVLQGSIQKRIEAGTRWERNKNAIIFKPGMTEHEIFALTRIQFTISQITH